MCTLSNMGGRRALACRCCQPPRLPSVHNAQPALCSSILTCCLSIATLQRALTPCSAVASPTPGANEMANPGSVVGLDIAFDNESDPEFTVITIEGKDQSDLLMSLTGA